MWRCFYLCLAQWKPKKFSPRMWRCFRSVSTLYFQLWIFSTYVEVFPDLVLQHRARLHFLHVCGGVSRLKNLENVLRRFSPRMWRCFHVKAECRRRQKIFSTYVEVFLRRTALICESTDFLHVCGGVSRWVCRPLMLMQFSPRMWRCFPIFLAI